MYCTSHFLSYNVLYKAKGVFYMKKNIPNSAKIKYGDIDKYLTAAEYIKKLNDSEMALIIQQTKLYLLQQEKISNRKN